MPGVAKGNIPWNKGKGEGWVDKRGYRWLRVNGRAKREHRVIMEKHLGRTLEPWEVVHHKDENPANNDLANLELVEWGKHTIEHHSHARHSWESRKSMELFGQLREEIKHLRSVNSDLLEAAKDMDLDCFYDVLNPCSLSKDNEHWGGVGEKCAPCRLRAAIAKAQGE